MYMRLKYRQIHAYLLIDNNVEDASDGARQYTGDVKDVCICGSSLIVTSLQYIINWLGREGKALS